MWSQYRKSHSKHQARADLCKPPREESPRVWEDYAVQKVEKQQTGEGSRSICSWRVGGSRGAALLL